jgi:catechol 2,3-dioxygenase-like lactoylglutathione lyase family enzyme
MIRRRHWEVRMLDAAAIVAFVATSDVPRAKAFYAEVLGLELVHEDGYALVFDAHGTMLRVTQVHEVTIAPYTVLGWAVPDAAAAVAALGERGVQFERYDGIEQDDQGIWTTPGGERVAWFKDPDGNTLSVSQHRS